METQAVKRSPLGVMYRRNLELITSQKQSSQRIVRYFSEVHLGNGHEGLTNLAKKHGIKISGLTRGEYVVFVNRAKTALKMFACGNVVAHLKMPSGKIDPRVIQLIPIFFNGKRIDYDSALEMVIKKEFGG